MYMMLVYIYIHTVYSNNKYCVYICIILHDLNMMTHIYIAKYIIRKAIYIYGYVHIYLCIYMCVYTEMYIYIYIDVYMQ